MDQYVPDSVQAWNDFCERLKVAGAVLARQTTPTDDLCQAEGLRKLARMIRMGLEATLEYADPGRPQVYPLVTRTTLGEGETSDAHYHQAIIDGSATYVLRGKRGGAPFIEFTLYAGKIGLDAHSRQIAALTEQDLQVDAAGNYELWLSPQPQQGAWLPTTPDTSVLFIRQYAHDWQKTQDASFDLRRVDAPPDERPLTLARVSAALQRTADYAAASVHTWAAIVDKLRAAPANRIFAFPTEGQDAEDAPEMPTGHRFASGHFRIGPDEALIVRFHPADVPYWGLDITNYWFEPMSWGEPRSHVNNRTVRRQGDGSVRIAIAARDPGEENWIDTRGHLEGVMLFRWSRTCEPLPAIEVERVVLAARP